MAMHFKRPQRGGTVLGFIGGVLVGLAGALAVAVYVTKVPVPFVDRVISRKASEDVAEAERNKNWNPNAVLGGKPAKTVAPPVAVQTDPPKPETESAIPVVKKESKTEPVKTEPAKGETAKSKTTSADPLGDMVQTKTQSKAGGSDAKAPASTGGEAFTYYVQVGAFRTPEDAQAQRAKLALMGLDAKVSERDQAGRTVYRVRLGPYEQLPDAERMKDTLEPSGLEAALVRVQR